MSVTNLPQEPRASRLQRDEERRARATNVAKEAADPRIAPGARASLRESTAIAARGRNLLFAGYPVRLARELLGLDVARMASQFGYSKNEWMRIEANMLTLPPELRRRIEDLVRTRLAENCRF